MGVNGLEAIKPGKISYEAGPIFQPPDLFRAKKGFLFNKSEQKLRKFRPRFFLGPAQGNPISPRACLPFVPGSFFALPAI